MPHPLLLGHRGARAGTSIPENSFASFDVALQHGCHGFEFDVRLTGDGRSVICHDPRYKGIEISQAMGDTLPELPLFGNLLARYQSRAFLDIELKVPGLEEATLAALRRHSPERGFVVSSFLPAVLQEINTRDAAIPLGIICDQREQLARWRELPITHVIPHHSLASRELVDEVHQAGKQVFVWTVNRAEDMVRLANWGADAIISDDTELLVRTLGKTS
jgi:glycerophosphoryl diester phosphodiesterase